VNAKPPVVAFVPYREKGRVTQRNGLDSNEKGKFGSNVEQEIEGKRESSGLRHAELRRWIIGGFQKKV